MEEDDDDLLDESNHEQEDLIKDTTPSPQKSATFGEALASLQFGSVPPNFQCNMIMVLPKQFKAKPNQPTTLVGDVEDTTESTVKIVEKAESTVKIVEKGKDPQSQSIKIENDEQGDNIVVLRTPDNALIRYLKPLYIKVHING